jgi:hypothetical protein
VRCRRESKECYFSATRRKRKADGDDATESLFDDAGTDDYIVRNGRKRLTVESSPPPKIDQRMYSDVPLTPGGTRGRPQPLRRPNDGPSHHSSIGSIDGHRESMSEFGNGEPNQALENLEAKQVMRQEVYGPHDALDLLYKAANIESVPDNDGHAGRHTDIRDFRSQSSVKQEDARRQMHHPSLPGGPYHTRQDSGVHKPSRGNDMNYDPGQASGRGASMSQQPIDPELTKRDPSAEPGYAEALHTWGRFRFVRAGWFTAAEAIEYIE